jgi:hypothetical protein
LAGWHFERGPNAAPLKAEALTSLAEADGLGKVRAHCIGALLCGVEPAAELDAAMLLKGASNRALAVLVIVAILRVLPDQNIQSLGELLRPNLAHQCYKLAQKNRWVLSFQQSFQQFVRYLCAQHPIKFQFQLQSSW